MITKFLKKRRTLVISVSAILFIYALAGFFLAPWILQKQLKQVLLDTYDSELVIEKTRINPFSFTVALSNIKLTDPAGSQLLQAENLAINFQLSSAFRRAWTFEELSITALEVFVARDENNSLNFSYFAEGGNDPAASEESEVSEEASGALLPLLVRHFIISDTFIHFTDDIPVNQVESHLGPINIELSDLSTLADRVAQQNIAIAYEETGLISLVGDVQLNPLALSGSVSIKGSYFPLLSQYIRDDTGIDITRGDIDIGLEYAVTTQANEELGVIVSNVNFALNGLGVSTYAQASDDPADVNQEFFALQAFTVSNVNLLWPEQEVSIDAVTFENPAVHIFRDEEGVFELTKMPALSASTAEESAGVDPQSEGVDDVDNSEEPLPWSFTLAELAVNHLIADLSDESIGTEGEIGISDFSFSLSDISLIPGQQFPMSMSAELLSGGTVELQGEVVMLPEPGFELAVNIDALALGVLRPYIRESVDIDFRSGELNLEADVLKSDEELLSFNGGAEIVNLAVHETEEGALIGSWEALRAETIALSLSNSSLAISEIELTQPYGDIEIARNGSLNLGRVSVEPETADIDQDSVQIEGQTVVEPEDVVSTDEENVAVEDNPAPNNPTATNSAPTDSTTENSTPMEITIGRINIVDGAADFADFSLPLPFSAAIEQLNGSMTTIATNSSEPSQVAFEGQVDEFGLLRISGHISPFDPKQNTDIALKFQNVNIPKFSAYTIPFAGREISNGLLDIELGYKINDSQLEGANLVVLRDVTLGDKVEHPDAMSLPLDLAVALLKGPDGNIDLDLPVSGNVDDPQFDYGNVISEAFSNIILNIVASPFKLLASLVGFEGDELEYIEFVAGRADLAPPELEKTANLAEALMLRPELMLELPGVTDLENDGEALRTERFEALVEAQILAMASDDSETDMYVEQRRSVVEALYQEYRVQNIDAPALALFQQDFMRPVEGAEQVAEQLVEQSEGQELQFDELAYMAALSTVLTAGQEISPADFEQLANDRANNIRLAVLENATNLQSRISLLEAVEVNSEPEEGVRMKVNISVNSN